MYILAYGGRKYLRMRQWCGLVGALWTGYHNASRKQHIRLDLSCSLIRSLVRLLRNFRFFLLAATHAIDIYF